jgi:hypothetical protein
VSQGRPRRICDGTGNIKISVKEVGCEGVRSCSMADSYISCVETSNSATFSNFVSNINKNSCKLYVTYFASAFFATAYLIGSDVHLFQTQIYCS